MGGGAAGFFCAANLDSSKFDIVILEQNTDVLQKVKISGGGRCNVTHACFDPRELVGFYPRGSKELRSVFTKFQPGDTMAWFEERGTALKIEDDNRVFPESNSSQSIIKVLQDESAKNSVQVKTQCAVSEIQDIEGKYLVKTKTGDMMADILIYTPGSSPKSMKIIQQLGHTIVKPVPSLFTFNIKDTLLEGIPGPSFAYAEVSIPQLKTSEYGPLLITHCGLSGPAIFKLSAWKARELAEQEYKFDIKVNFINLNQQDAEETFNQVKIQEGKKSIGQCKIFAVTNRFWNKVLEVCRVDPNKQISHLGKKEIQQIVETLCAKRCKVSGKSTFKDEFVTAGGVDLKEIDFKTMQSKILPNCYIAGEVLNIDAITGGFNFQACWSEAWLIAQALNTSEI